MTRSAQRHSPPDRPQVVGGPPGAGPRPSGDGGPPRRAAAMGLVVAALTVVGALLLPPSGDPAAPPSTPPGGTATPPAPDAPAPSVRLGDAILGAGWEELEAGPVAGRHDPVAVWTGSRLFVWGGFEPASSAASAVSSWHRDGALYDPIAGLWSPWE